MKDQVVDIIIPVYGDFTATQNCIESVLKYFDGSQNLILINDKSPDQKIPKYLKQIKKENSRITLIEHKINQGFVRTVNEGMSLSKVNDVILLNSDTIVTKNWVNKLRDRAYIRDNVATVTPFSNCATIFSYPQKNCSNAISQNKAEIINAALEATADKTVIDVPTGHGFCIYITRKSINSVGFFDAETFGRGYGEENDFCQRAKLCGFLNLACHNCYIYHQDGASFGSGKRREQLRKQAFEKVLCRHPRYLKEIEDFELADPFRFIRARVDIYLLQNNKKPTLLLIQHNWGGGSECTVQETATAAIKNNWNSLILKPYSSGVRLYSSSSPNIDLVFIGNDWYKKLVSVLSVMNLKHIHFHHLVEVPEEIKRLPTDLQLKYDFTIHDYFSVCPRINFLKPGNIYCGATTNNKECDNCLDSENVISEWRNKNGTFLRGARKVFAPSETAKLMINTYFKDLKILVIGHPYANYRNSFVFNLTNITKRKLNIVLIGAISYTKGLGVLESCIRYTKQNNLPLNWIVLGPTENDSKLAGVKITGHYDGREELKGMLDKGGFDLVLLPSIWPETFSYVLSEAWESGLPVLVANLGALAERVASTGAGWIISPFNAENICKTIIEIKNNPEKLTEKIEKISNFKPKKDFAWDKYYGSLIIEDAVKLANSQLIDNVLETSVYVGKVPKLEERIKRIEHKNYINEQKTNLLTERCNLITNSRVWKLRNKVAKHIGRGEI